MQRLGSSQSCPCWTAIFPPRWAKALLRSPKRTSCSPCTMKVKTGVFSRWPDGELRISAPALRPDETRQTESGGRPVARQGGLGERPLEALTRRGLVRLPRRERSPRSARIKAAGPVSALVAEQRG